MTKASVYVSAARSVQSTAVRAATILAVVGTVAPSFGQDQPILSPVPRAGNFFGEEVVNVGDVDGDGFPDLAATEPAPAPVGPVTAWRTREDAGRVHLYSGRTGAFIRTIWQRDDIGFADAHLGGSIAAMGDLDGDGLGDLAVAAPDAPNDRLSAGRVFFYSGGTGELLRVIGTGYLPRMSQSAMRIAPAGDVDADGKTDLLVLARAYGVERLPALAAFNQNFDDLVDLHSDNPPPELRLYVYSGATGRPLLRVDEHVGTTFAGVGDVNADGHDDIAVVSGGLADERVVHVISGRSGRRIRTFTAPESSSAPSSGFGLAVSGAGDVNRDGWDDVAVYAPDLGTGRGEWIDVFSGRSGRLLRTTTLDLPDGSVPVDATLEVVPDLTGDGRPEIMLIRTLHGPTIEAPGPSGVAIDRAWRLSIVDPGRTRVVQEIDGDGEFFQSAAVLPGADGEREIAVGLPGYTPSHGLESSGAVRIYR